MSSLLVCQMDCAEPRVKKDRLVVSADGSTWDLDASETATYNGLYNDLFLDPISGLMMLYPLPWTDAWANTFTGNYARYGKANYSLITPDNWVEFDRTAVGDKYLKGLGTNERVTTTASFAANQAVTIAVVVGGTGTETVSILECGWGTPGAAGTVSLRFRSSGEAEVYKGTQRVGFYSYRDLKSDVGLSFKAKRNKKKGSVGGNTLSLLLIPRHTRTLLVLSNAGGGFNHVFEDLSGTADGNTITSAGAFWWKVPNGEPVVQFAPLKYATSGATYSPPVKLRYAPAPGQTFIPTVAEGVPSTGTTTFTPTLVKPDFSTYTPDGSQRDVRLRAYMSGDGNTTRFLYAVDMVCMGTKTTTSDTPFDLLPYLIKLTMEVPEDGPASLHLTCLNPDAMDAGGLAKARIIGDRPIRLSVGGKDIFRGTTGKPIVTEGAGFGRTQGTTIEWTAGDREAEFSMYTFRDTFPYDGIGLSDAIKQIAKLPGFADTDLDITTDTFTLPYSTEVSQGKWQLLPKRGDSAATWINRLWEDYAKTWVKGWTPTADGYKYRFRRPDTFSNMPLLGLSESDDDAKLFGISPEWVTRRTVRSLKRLPEAAPANEVLAVGYDETTDTYPQAQYDDAASQNPELAPADRPDNWRGRVVSYQMIDPQIINSQATADRARDILRDRACVSREIIEIECEFLVRATGNLPLWKGDVVRIYKSVSAVGVGIPHGDYRILAIPSIEFLLEGDRTVPLRPCTYRLLKIGPGT